MAYISNSNTNTPMASRAKENQPSKDIARPLDTLSLPDVQSKTIDKTFGRPNDYIELHIYNNSNQLIHSENYFEDYISPTNQEVTPPLTNKIQVDPNKILNDRGYFSGQYIIKLNLLKNKVFDTDQFPFFIKEISSDRREIKSVSPQNQNKVIDPAVSSFIADIESSAYFKEFSLNFGKDVLIPSINILLNKGPEKHEILLKTLNPLPNIISNNSVFKIVEEITDPLLIRVDLGKFTLEPEKIYISGPNFKIDTRQKNSTPSEFKNFDSILNYSITSSYQHLLNKLETNNIDLNIDYDYIRPVSESSEEKVYHFENFVHFSSATERLKNFKYKLQLIEEYDNQLLSISKITGDTTASNTVVTNKNNINSKKEKLIKGLDGYEQFLYYTSGTFAWPKQTSQKPFTLYSVSSSEAISWLGEEFTSPTGSGQLLSASLYDKQNEHSLNKLIPSHVIENSDNSIYVNFIDMVGHHFDGIWSYIKAMSNIHNTDHVRGISKDLVYHKLKDIGLEIFDQFENSNLLEYHLGESTSGSAFYGHDHYFKYSTEHHSSSLGFGLAVSASETLVTSSNEGSTPKSDITTEIWKRLYHNAPYLLKTKGTERGIRALISCYGIPSTILNVKEYGGSTTYSGPLKDVDLTKYYKTFSYEKSSLYLNTSTAPTNTEHLIRFPWKGNNIGPTTEKSIELRILPEKGNEGQILRLSNTDDATGGSVCGIWLDKYTGNDISSSGDASDYGRLQLKLATAVIESTEYFPLYNGDFWNIHLIGISGSLTTQNVKFGAYQTNHLKNTFKYTSSSNAIQYEAYFGKDSGDGREYIYAGASGYKGGIQELRSHWGEALTDTTLTKHSLEPFMYSGNTVSSSFNNLIIRLPLGSTDVETLENHPPNTSLINANTVADSDFTSTFLELTETHHLPTPDTVGASMTSEKVRIDEGSVDGNLLSPYVKGETSTLDRQPQDFEDLGIFFSPTNEINEDILYTLGSFRMDDYIGSPLPADQTSSYYSDLKTIKKEYFKKVNNRYNYWDYIKQIQYIDHTLFKMIEQFAPAKSNLKTGLLIEPHFLERNKFERTLPIRSDGQTMEEGLHQTFDAGINGKIHTMRSSSATDFGQKGISRVLHLKNTNLSADIEGQHDPGSYVVYHSNPSPATSSRGEKKDFGTNGTVNIFDDYIDPSSIDPNRENQQECQSPINPYKGSKPYNYVSHQSSVLLGNAVESKKSNKYYRYKEYFQTTSSLY